MQLMKSVAFLSLAMSRHSFQHVSLDWHRWLQKFRVPMHFLSCWQVVSWLLQYFSMHSWGVPRITASFEVESASILIIWLLTWSRQLLSMIHFHKLLAGVLPFLAMQLVQQLLSFEHSLSQSWRALRQPASLEQAVASSEQWSLMHSWGVKRATTFEDFVVEFL